MPNDNSPVQIRQHMNVPALCHDNIFVDADKETFQKMFLPIWGNGDAWVLGHVTDGVLWGKVYQTKLILANDADPSFGPSLDKNRLLDLRIFSPEKELRIWRQHGKLHGCLVHENTSKGYCYGYDEYQVFVSAKRDGQAAADGVIFSRLRGPSGQTHAMPVDWDGTGQKWRLKVRHYLNAAETGMLTVTESRLLEICLKRRGD